MLRKIIFLRNNKTREGGGDGSAGDRTGEEGAPRGVAELLSCGKKSSLQVYYLLPGGFNFKLGTSEDEVLFYNFFLKGNCFCFFIRLFELGIHEIGKVSKRNNIVTK
jgi:hypothetical protein